MKRILPIYRYIRSFLTYLKPMQISLHSAYTSFFLILSLFPCMLLLLGLLKYTPLGVRELLDLLEGLLPESLLPLAKWLAETSYAHSSGTVISVSAVAALWSASRGMYGLHRGLNAIYGPVPGRGYLRSRIFSMLYTLVFLLALTATLVAHVFGSALLDFLQMTTRPGILVLMGIVDLRFFLLLTLLTVLFAAMYALLPRRKGRFSRQLPGALFAALGWLLSAELFSVYMAHFGRYTNIFGSLYGLALGMLWLYFCVSLMLCGGVLNRLILEKKWQFS